MFGGFNFFWIFFVEVTELLNFWMLENRVSIKSHFCIQRYNIAVVRFNEGIDLDQHRVIFPVQIVQVG